MTAIVMMIPAGVGVVITVSRIVSGVNKSRRAVTVVTVRRVR